MMIKKLTVSGDVIDIRSDHLKGLVDYGLMQAHCSCIKVLDFGANENALDLEEQIEYMQQLLYALVELTADGNCDLLIVKANQEDVDRYHELNQL